MLQFILGIALGFLSGYLYGSERARDEALRRLANAQEPVLRATDHVSEAIASAPIPDTVKQTAGRATAGIKSATQQATQRAADVPDAAQRAATEAADRLSEPLSQIDPDSPATLPS
jgi:hypothetical protein